MKKVNKKYSDKMFQRLMERYYYDGDKKAREQLIELNIPLVRFVAKRYIDRGMEYEDLIHEGTLGLIRALDKFDLSLGFKFGTYATWWIKQNIEKSLLSIGSTIKKPANYTESLKKIILFRNAFLLQHNRFPTNKEISKATKMTLERVKSLQGLLSGVKSLDDPIGTDSMGGEDFKILDNIPGDPDKYFQHELSGVLGEMIKDLEEKEKQIIKMRFGLGGYDAKSLRVIGHELNLSQERVRQIEVQALRKLKTHNNYNLLTGFLTEA